MLSMAGDSALQPFSWFSLCDSAALREIWDFRLEHFQKKCSRKNGGCDILSRHSIKSESAAGSRTSRTGRPAVGPENGYNILENALAACDIRIATGDGRGA
ncbi:MAG: hypothetical protein J6Y19_08295, partial [Kiritimatiellae bacterium]|nr:hypothetical protein [Kiritimatiellia bacterium]